MLKVMGLLMDYGTIGRGESRSIESLLAAKAYFGAT